MTIPYPSITVPADFPTKTHMHLDIKDRNPSKILRASG